MANINGLLSLIVEHGLLSYAQAQHAITSYGTNRSLISYLVTNKLIDSTTIANIFSREFSLPLFDLTSFDIHQLPVKFLNKKRTVRHSALPLFIRENRLYIAMSDPTNNTALEEFQFNAGMRTETILVCEQQLNKLISIVFDGKSNELPFNELDEQDFTEMKLNDSVDIINQENEHDDQPIVAYINKLLRDAIDKGASDLHFEPYENIYRVRFRIDGILHNIDSPPAYLSSRLSARIKIMSKMDIAEKRIPQDGRIRFTLSKNTSIDFRVSSLPTLFGEKIVLRILDSSMTMIGIDMLGYDNQQRALYEKSLQRPQGMILVTGPTGSGKTVSLYAGLNILNTPERNISTAEDPVELNLVGINQVQINNKAGLDFSSTLRAFLRQDPDVVMVGEIRDLETAEIAIKAAQTGHLVLSTLHTNSAAETISRLRNMGIPGYNIASSVTLIIAQRLARRLCEHCKKPEHIPKAKLLDLGFTEKDLLHSPILYQAHGCDKCSNGYQGRIGIYETMPISKKISKTIVADEDISKIAEVAQLEGINDLRRSGLIKVLEGLTSLTEINRVINF